MSDAILGTFVKIGTMADGTPRLVLDLQCTLSEIAAMGLIPGVPFALARLTKESSVAPVSQPQEQKERPGQLCVMACSFCADKTFWQWLERHYNCDCDNEQQAKDILLDLCEIASRRELDSNPTAADRFHTIIRKPFVAWRDAR